MPDHDADLDACLAVAGWSAIPMAGPGLRTGLAALDAAPRVAQRCADAERLLEVLTRTMHTIEAGKAIDRRMVLVHREDGETCWRVWYGDGTICAPEGYPTPGAAFAAARAWLKENGGIDGS